jgi:hypothetical protein
MKYPGGGFAVGLAEGLALYDMVINVERVASVPVLVFVGRKE